MFNTEWRNSTPERSAKRWKRSRLLSACRRGSIHATASAWEIARPGRAWPRWLIHTLRIGILDPELQTVAAVRRQPDHRTRPLRKFSREGGLRALNRAGDSYF